MPTEQNGEPDSAVAITQDFWQFLKLPHYVHEHPPVKNANDINSDRLSPIDKLAIAITDKVGSFGFFAIIFVWTIIWCGYNILATEVPVLHWKSFDPFPAFVAYLLISNVIQILLMPLIMVGQNLQGRHAEIRAELDYETNVKAEKEVEILLRHIEHNSELLVHLMRHVNCRLTEQEQEELKHHRDVMVQIVDQGVNPSSLPNGGSK
ncbi:MAG: DUF1003 domain-containing protein [Capsulimonadaceae bacterium]|nr:DUF1003 domain-containing protein [Capsulimonadaceae bacterium]